MRVHMLCACMYAFLHVMNFTVICSTNVSISIYVCISLLVFHLQCPMHFLKYEMCDVYFRSIFSLLAGYPRFHLIPVCKKCVSQNGLIHSALHFESVRRVVCFESQINIKNQS